MENKEYATLSQAFISISNPRQAWKVEHNLVEMECQPFFVQGLVKIVRVMRGVKWDS